MHNHDKKAFYVSEVFVITFSALTTKTANRIFVPLCLHGNILIFPLHFDSYQIVALHLYKQNILCPFLNDQIS